MAGAPMLKDGVPIGAILVAWPEPGATPQRQVDLFKTFADQAVIAIENVRLFNETKEALEQQTATAEILRVISSSPNDVQPVFDAIAKRARLLCSADSSAVRLPAGEGLVARARDLSERALAAPIGRARGRADPPHARSPGAPFSKRAVAPHRGRADAGRRVSGRARHRTAERLPDRARRPDAARRQLDRHHQPACATTCARSRPPRSRC